MDSSSGQTQHPAASTRALCYIVPRVAEQGPTLGTWLPSEAGVSPLSLVPVEAWTPRAAGEPGLAFRTWETQSLLSKNLSGAIWDLNLLLRCNVIMRSG